VRRRGFPSTPNITKGVENSVGVCLHAGTSERYPGTGQHVPGVPKRFLRDETLPTVAWALQPMCAKAFVQPPPCSVVKNRPRTGCKPPLSHQCSTCLALTVATPAAGGARSWAYNDKETCGSTQTWMSSSPRNCIPGLHTHRKLFGCYRMPSSKGIQAPWSCY
jgi:hypothetical protein